MDIFGYFLQMNFGDDHPLKNIGPLSLFTKNFVRLMDIFGLLVDIFGHLTFVLNNFSRILLINIVMTNFSIFR